MHHPRLVVCLVGDAVNGQLCESQFVDRPFLPGGEHNLYELAFAAAALGHEVELRGCLHRGSFDRLRGAVGVAPVVDLPARPPDRRDVVVIPEGWRNPTEYGRMMLAGVPVAIFLLAPSGLFGWSFAREWSLPDPLTVELDAVARPEHFRAMWELGFTLLTHSPALAQAVDESGVPCHFIGVGRPDPAPHRGAPPHHDVVGLLANRWAPLVREVAAALDGYRVDLVPEVSNEEIGRRLAAARVLLWPSRIEGHATIPWEARRVGCVPVALASNRFAVGLTPDAGAVAVERLDQLAPEIHGLLADEPRWQKLSERARVAAAEESDWSRYLERVGAFLTGFGQRHAAHDAAGTVGSALLRSAASTAASAQARLEEIELERHRVTLDRDRLRGELVASQEDRDRLAAELESLRNRRSVRLALHVANGLSRRREPAGR